MKWTTLASVQIFILSGMMCSLATKPLLSMFSSQTLATRKWSEINTIDERSLSNNGKAFFFPQKQNRVVFWSPFFFFSQCMEFKKKSNTKKAKMKLCLYVYDFIFCSLYFELSWKGYPKTNNKLLSLVFLIVYFCGFSMFCLSLNCWTEIWLAVLLEAPVVSRWLLWWTLSFVSEGRKKVCLDGIGF